MQPDGNLTRILEHLTGQTRRALARACREARANQDDYVGTEHLLIGILHEPDSGAAMLLKSLNTDAEAIQRRLRVLPKDRPTGPDMALLPLTPRAKIALGMAEEEALHQGQRFIATEHVLVGLSLDEDSMAQFLLQELNVSVDQLRTALARLPPSENRDQLVQLAPSVGTLSRADPSAGELLQLLSMSSLVPAAVADTSTMNSPAADELARTRRQTKTLQFLVGLFMGTVAGAALGGWKMLACMLAGAVVGVVRNRWIGAIGGIAVGFVLADVLCPHQPIQGVFLILVALFAGAFLGDSPSISHFGGDSDDQADGSGP